MAEYKSICRSCFHSYVCEQFNEYRERDNKKCHFANSHFVPTADVVEVVRCCDCKHFMEYANEGKVEGADGDCFIRMSYSLDHQFYAVKCDDFCSCGIKRGEDNA